MPSSYDIEAGGEFPREQAIDMEVLPPAGDRQFQDYYDEQMAALDAQNAANADDEFEQKHGFRRDDPSIIDVTDQPSGASGSAVANRADTALGKPKQIWFAVNTHMPAGGMLGYDPSNRLGRRDPRASRGYLREAEGAAKDRILKLCASGDLKWEDVAKAFVEKASEQQARDVAAESGWFQMDEGEMNEKHVEGIDNVIDALDKVKKLSESLDESVDYNAVGIISQGLRAIESAILRLQKTISGNVSVSETEESDPQNLDREIAEAGRAAEEIDSEESDPLDESVTADVGEWNRILGSIR